MECFKNFFCDIGFGVVVECIVFVCDFIVGIFGVEYGEVIVVFGGEDYVVYVCCFGSFCLFCWIEFYWVECFFKAFVFFFVVYVIICMVIFCVFILIIIFWVEGLGFYNVLLVVGALVY